MNHYEVLGIRKAATQKEIKSAYKKLVKKYHPDIYPGDKSYAELKIKEINNAYDVLSNPHLKQEYDESLSPNPIYSYTPPTYNTTYTSQYSYNNYKKSHTTSSYYQNYANNNRTKTSNQDYTNYAHMRYTDYHRSKTPNSNYTNNSNNDFLDSVINKFSNLTSNTKLKIIFIVIIFYIVFVIINIFQLSSLLNNNQSKSNLNSSSKIEHSTDNQHTPSQKNSNEKTNTSSDSSQYNNSFNINDYFSDSQLKDVYEKHYKEQYSSFYEFKKAVSQAYQEYYF